MIALCCALLTLVQPVSISSVPTKLTPDITGAYFFVEKPPKAFEDVDWIALFAVDAKGHKVPLSGFLRLKETRNGKFVNFFLVTPNLSGHTLSFSTKAIRGISYRFEGEFMKLENLEDNEIVLKGRLSKFRNRRKIAEVVARYYYFAGD